MLTIKLISSNYLLWKNQIIPLLSYQDLMPYVDRTSRISYETITKGDQKIFNPLLAPWLAADHKVVILLNVSLSEEVATEIIGLTIAYEIWNAPEQAYSNASVERIHHISDDLRRLAKGNTTVAEYGRKFKLLCEQLTIIENSVTDVEKVHWFLNGLGP